MNFLKIPHYLFLASMRFSLSCLVLCLSLTQILYASTVNSQLTAEQWLKKMQMAAIHESFRGVFVFTRNESASSMRVVHRYQNGEEQERLTQLDGEMGEIIRRGTEVICILPDNRVLQVEQSKLTSKIAQAFGKFEPDHSFYQIKMVGQDRLVNRPIIKISVTAKDNYRYSYLLWLDQQTGLLLKSSLQNDQGVELEYFQYTQIEFPPFIDDQEMQVMNSGALVEHEVISAPKKDKRWPAGMMWVIEWTPPGFEQVSGSVKPGDNVMVYSDGLASYSVFIEESENEMLPEGASLVGATVAYAQKLESGSHHYNVTVVGEVPAMTAMLVAESVKPAKE